MSEEINLEEVKSARAVIQNGKKGRPALVDTRDKITQVSLSMEPSSKNILKLLAEVLESRSMSATARVLIRVSSIKLLIKSPKFESIKERLIENMTEEEINFYL